MSKAQVNKLFADTKSLEEKGKTLEARNQQWFTLAENKIGYLDAENEALKKRVDQLEKIIGEHLPGVALQSASQRQT